MSPLAPGIGSCHCPLNVCAIFPGVAILRFAADLFLLLMPHSLISCGGRYRSIGQSLWSYWCWVPAGKAQSWLIRGDGDVAV